MPRPNPLPMPRSSQLGDDVWEPDAHAHFASVLTFFGNANENAFGIGMRSEGSRYDGFDGLRDEWKRQSMMAQKSAARLLVRAVLAIYGYRPWRDHPPLTVEVAYDGPAGIAALCAVRVVSVVEEGDRIDRVNVRYVDKFDEPDPDDAYRLRLTQGREGA